MFTKLLTLVVLLVPIVTAAADDRPLTLDEAVERALGQSPEVVASSAMLDAARARAPSAGRLPDPQFVAAVDNLPIDTDDRLSFSRDFMTMRRVGLMQTFPSRAKRQLQRTYAGQEVVVAEAELRKTRFETARATAQAWIEAAVADESLTRLRELQPDVALQASAARSALSSGRATTTDAFAAQTIVARLDDRILALEQDAQMRRAELVRWVGDAAERPLATIPIDLEVAHSPESLVAGVPQHAPLAPLVARIAAAQTEVDLARAEKRPDWSAELSYQKRGSDFSDMVSLEFRVGLPLFARNRQNPVIAAKLATVRAEEAERDAEIRMHTAEVNATLAAWRHGRTRLDHYRAELLPLARDRAHATVTSYGAGRGDLRSAIDALTDEINTELDYIALKGSVARAWTFLHLLHDAGGAP